MINKITNYNNINHSGLNPKMGSQTLSYIDFQMPNKNKQRIKICTDSHHPKRQDKVKGKKYVVNTYVSKQLLVNTN